MFDIGIRSQVKNGRFWGLSVIRSGHQIASLACGGDSCDMPRASITLRAWDRPEVHPRVGASPTLLSTLCTVRSTCNASITERLTPARFNFLSSACWIRKASAATKMCPSRRSPAPLPQQPEPNAPITPPSTDVPNHPNAVPAEIIPPKLATARCRE